MENTFINFIDLDTPPNDIQKLIADYYDGMSPMIEQIKAKLFQQDVLGESLCGYYLLMDIEFLLIYLLLLNKKMNEIRGSEPCAVLTSEDKNTLLEEWKLECIRKTFLCKGVKVDKVLKLNILPAYKSFDVGTNIGDVGIGFMYIEGPETNDCTNKETFIVK